MHSDKRFSHQADLPAQLSSAQPIPAQPSHHPHEPLSPQKQLPTKLSQHTLENGQLMARTTTQQYIPMAEMTRPSLPSPSAGLALTRTSSNKHPAQKPASTCTECAHLQYTHARRRLSGLIWSALIARAIPRSHRGQYIVYIYIYKNHSVHAHDALHDND